MSTYHYVACDLGAESGRVVLGTLSDGRVAIEEIHRFPTGAISIGGSLRWDLLRSFDELKTGLRKVAARGLPIASVSTDSWGVDYVFLHGREPMLGLPYHYRDARLDGSMEKAFAKVPADKIFAESGIQFMQLNTLYQLLTDLEQRPKLLKLVEKFLTIGDYFNYLFSGAKKVEVSLASTTQLYDPRKRKWSRELIKSFGLPAKIFPEIVPSGAKLGPLLPEIASETGLQGVEVVASCSHDTGAAVAAVPGEGDDWAYLSSGTWSLLGIESEKPIITDKSRAYNFTNEVGYDHTIRFLKNIIGLWVVQECRRAWANAGQEYSYDQLTKLADEAPPLKRFINPAAARFAKPGGMPEKIAGYCRETGQTPPESVGATVRCVLESLALLYDRTLREIATVTGQKIARLHIVGGGSKNTLLNQLSANATQVPVHTGTVEATAIGNILIQALGLGHLPSLAAARDVVRQSFPVSIHRPQDAGVWQDAKERFGRLTLAT
ncbi:MAG: rhamnulokinase [Planctomycetota bacterium]|nr:rhamnulokinase [Planctomycetota bacterium]